VGEAEGRVDRTTVVEVTVLGSVSLPVAELAELGARSAVECTQLEATVRDQAALYGLLQRLASLGLELVELRTGGPGHRTDVDVVVRGRVGALARRMLDGVERVHPGARTARRVDEEDLAALLAAVVARSPLAGEDAPSASGHGGDADAPPGARLPATPTGEGPMDRDTDEMGPIDYIVVEFPENRLDGEALPLLLDLVDRGIIRVLDLAFVRKSASGEVSAADLRNLDATGGFDLTVFEGASSGILGDDDLEEAGAALAPGAAAGVLVYENTWAAPFAAALRRGGGSLVAGGRIPVEAVVAALDAADAS